MSAPSLEGISENAKHQLTRLRTISVIEWPCGEPHKSTPFRSFEYLLDRGFITKHSSPQGRRITARITETGKALWPLIEAEQAERARQTRLEEIAQDRAAIVRGRAERLHASLKLMCEGATMKQIGEAKALLKEIEEKQAAIK